MAARGSRGTSSLFTPLNVLDVLIPDEIVQYNERIHWASLIQPFFETVAILIMITMFAGGLPTGAAGGFMMLFVAVMIFIVYRQKKWKKAALYAGTFGLLLGFVIFGLESMAIALILGAATRFVYRAAMWAFYDRLYITNRRVIASSGFLGANIDAMPLTRITDIAFKRTVPGEILDYGTLRIESAGQDQALGLLTFLNQPDMFYNILIGLSTTAIGSVKPPLTKEKMAESRAVTIKPGGDRPVRLPSVLRRFSPSAGSTARAAGPESVTDELGSDGEITQVTPVTRVDFEDGT